MPVDHAGVVRRSFERQVELFTGPDSLFASRPATSLAWIEPRDENMVVLDVPEPEVRERYDFVHRLIDPSHVRAFLDYELADLLPGGVDELSYADKATFRFPIDVAITDQSERDEVLGILTAEARGVEAAEPTGFEPTEEDGRIVVSFTNCVVHAERR